MYIKKNVKFFLFTNAIIGTAGRGQESELSSIPVKDGVKKKGMILPFQPLTMTFHAVNYFVDMPKVWW